MKETTSVIRTMKDSAVKLKINKKSRNRNYFRYGSKQSTLSIDTFVREPTTQSKGWGVNTKQLRAQELRQVRREQDRGELGQR